MSKFDLDQAVTTFAIQLVATFAGCTAALFVWKHVLGGAVLVN